MSFRTMSENWTVFGRDQGQIVECAYRYHEDSESVIRRVWDRSDDSVAYYRADMVEPEEWTPEWEWNGSEGDHDICHLDFEEIDANPFRD